MSLVYCLMGPTASGKTGLSIALAKRFDIEIINVDSAMIYRGMDIGTAKPTLTERQGVVHHLVDIKQPHQAYSAGDFCDDAKRLIDDMIARGKKPLLVGGTMMYFKALQQGIADLPASDPELREQLLQQGESLGWPALHQQLASYDPEAAERINPNDKQRIQRALEVYQLSGQPISRLQQQQNDSDTTFVNMAIMPEDRSLLHQRIAERVDSMLNAGFDQEVRELIARPEMHSDVPSMRAVGYRQWVMYLNGKLDADQAKEAMMVATRQLAKRQLTWLRHWPNLHRLAMDDTNILEIASSFIENAAAS